MSRSRPKSATSNANEPVMNASALPLLLATLTIALTLIRLLIPTEGSVHGQTLWVCQGWFLVALLAVWQRWRFPQSARPWDLLDLGVAVLVLAHVGSALRVILLHDGERRLALNLLWEWCALGVSFALFRDQIRGSLQRLAWMRVLTAFAVSLAALGLWQHYVSYPAQIPEYDALLKEYEAFTGSAAADADGAIRRAERLRELEQEFARQGIPREGPAQRLFEDRLRGSSEPIATFALANSFAGWLAAWGVVGAGLCLAARGAGSPKSWSGPVLNALLLGLIAYCLVLTKSRTAWLGLIVGCGVWAWISRRSRRLESGRAASLWKWWLIVPAVLVSGFGVAALSGGFDSAVVSQAPRSLKFRLQYWTGAAQVIQERWFWGTGPGNFRPHYLQQKAAESSEEIADPHNFVLDLWTSGGLLALVGFSLAVIGVARSLASNEPAASPEEPGLPGSHDAIWIVRGAWLAFAFWMGTILLLGGDQFQMGRLFGIAAVWEMAMRIGRWAGWRHPASAGCVIGAATGLLVHLLGAGGIEMPAITQLLLLLATFLAPAPVAVVSSDAGVSGPRRVVIAGVCSLAGFIGCLLTATLPVAARESAIQRGDERIVQSGPSSGAEAAYREAAEADVLSPIPHERMTELLFRRWGGARRDEEALFQSALKSGERAIAANPYSPNGYRRMAELWTARAERSRRHEHAVAAVEWFAKAVERYPNYAPLRAEQAAALRRAGRMEEAARIAELTVELDAINRREGHADKFLPEATLRELRELTGRH